MPDKNNLAKIHIAKKELGLTDEAYRDILHLHFRVASAADLNDRQAAALLEQFKLRGWRPMRGKRRPGHNTRPQRHPMAGKVLALWITLGKAGVLRSSGTDESLQKWVKRMTGVDNLAWCTPAQLFRLIEALKDWAKREKVENGKVI